ncbi:MAG: hypothetical protein IJX13_02605, partial [Clostridia bacterium]|nr:hypothetical protein [Clostridia bacterium]
MIVTFQLSNQIFKDALAVSVNGETKELSARNPQINFEISDPQELTVWVEYVSERHRDVKKTIWKNLLHSIAFVLSKAETVYRSHWRIGTSERDYFFHEVEPFELKKCFKIQPTEMIIWVKYIPSEYDESENSISAPDIEMVGTEATEQENVMQYNREYMKQEFHLHYYPAYMGWFLTSVGLGLCVITSWFFGGSKSDDFLNILSLLFIIAVAWGVLAWGIYEFVSLCKI